MESSVFKWRESKGVGTLTLQRPEVHNALNNEMVHELTNFIKALSQNNGLRFMIIRGAGKSFCAGADLNSMKAMKDYSPEENLEEARHLQELFETMNLTPFPTLGFIHGVALGGGSGLVACLDFVLATPETLFGFPEVALGLLPAVISPFVVSKIGLSAARAYFSSGLRFCAQRALEMGLIHQIGSEEDLEKIQDLFLKAAPGASRLAKKLALQIGEGEKAQEQWGEHTRKLIARVRTQEEAQEGMGAMLEKRPPSWR